MTYAVVKDGQIIQYPVYEPDIKAAYPNTSFPIPFEPPSSDYVLVQSTIPPTVNWDQNITEKKPKLNNEGVWIQTWEITDASPEEKQQRTAAQAINVRTDRNRRLADCDWTQLSDAPVDHQAWATYRQALRDVSSQPGFPWDVQWPEKP